ncbi:MAG: hypothetical protein J7K68_00535 [Candidatus Diapherotrites archaeon]|nr:hypothetical protein [Candidatus Diapherotrites archaeon]
MTELQGLCDICGKPAKLYTCWRCGRRVCEKHFDKSTGLCVICSKEKREKGVVEPGQLFVPSSEKPTTVKPGDIRK